MFCETATDADAVQLLEGSVTVTEYVPGVVTVRVVPLPPPLQPYVTPGVVDEAVSVTLVTKQFNVAGVAILMFGFITVCDTVTEADAVHPLPGSVTVTVYPPGELTVLLAIPVPLLQLYVTPGVVDEAERVTLVTVHVAGEAMLTFGIEMF
jgi:hypothetical protein